MAVQKSDEVFYRVRQLTATFVFQKIESPKGWQVKIRSLFFEVFIEAVRYTRKESCIFQSMQFSDNLRPGSKDIEDQIAELIAQALFEAIKKTNLNRQSQQEDKTK